MKKEKMDSQILIPGFLLIGLGLGFVFMDRFPLAIPAFLLVGLGVGMILAYVFREKK